jgi:hypothetical protein
MSALHDKAVDVKIFGHRAAMVLKVAYIPLAGGAVRGSCRCGRNIANVIWQHRVGDVPTKWIDPTRRVK